MRVGDLIKALVDLCHNKGVDQEVGLQVFDGVQYVSGPLTGIGIDVYEVVSGCAVVLRCNFDPATGRPVEDGVDA